MDWGATVTLPTKSPLRKEKVSSATPLQVQTLVRVGPNLTGPPRITHPTDLENFDMKQQSQRLSTFTNKRDETSYLLHGSPHSPTNWST